MDKSKIDEESEKWVNDSRNTLYWTGKGRVYRSWPLDKNSVLLTDIENGIQTKVSNLEINLDVKNGNLVEIDFNTSIYLPSGGTTRVRATSPEKEESLVGVYKKKAEAPRYRKADSSLTPAPRSPAQEYEGTALPALASPEDSEELPRIAAKAAAPALPRYRRRQG